MAEFAGFFFRSSVLLVCYLNIGRTLAGRHGEKCIISSHRVSVASNCGQGWSAMVTKRRGGVRGSQAKNVRKKCLQVPSRLMGRRNVSENSVPNQMCGRGGVARDATITSRQGCGESTGRRLRREVVRGPRAFLRRVERRIRSAKVRRQRLKSFGPRLSGFEDQEERQNKMDRVFPPEGKVVLRKTGAWKWRMRS